MIGCRSSPVLSAFWTFSWAAEHFAVLKKLRCRDTGQAERGGGSQHTNHEKPILYSCGDFINDYEGIAGYEHYRGDLSLMYFPVIDPASGDLVDMVIHLMKRKRFQTVSPSPSDHQWIADILNREGKNSAPRW